MKLRKIFLVIIPLILICAYLQASQSDKEIDGLSILNQNQIAYTDVNFFRYLNKDKVEIVSAFLDAGYDVNKPNQASQTPLMVAAQKGTYRICELLLQRGADVNAVDCDSCTALMYAASYRHAKVAELLISYEADVNIQNDNGWTALMFAIDSGNKNTIDALITIDTDPMLRNKDNKSARDFAKEHRFDKLTQYIADKQAYLHNQKGAKHKKNTSKPKKF